MHQPNYLEVTLAKQSENTIPITYEPSKTCTAELKNDQIQKKVKKYLYKIVTKHHTNGEVEFLVICIRE